VNVLNRRQLEEAEDSVSVRARLVEEYRATFANPYVAAARGYLDDILEPAQTRSALAAALEVLQSKRKPRPQKKHGLIPL
jgi:acetyl-CoA carboxylase carboxyltransferase component